MAKTKIYARDMIILLAWMNLEESIKASKKRKNCRVRLIESFNDFEVASITGSDKIHLWIRGEFKGIYDKESVINTIMNYIL